MVEAAAEAAKTAEGAKGTAEFDAEAARACRKIGGDDTYKGVNIEAIPANILHESRQLKIAFRFRERVTTDLEAGSVRNANGPYKLEIV